MRATWSHRDHPPVVTDAPESPRQERRRRERRYAVLMVVHLVGLTVGVLLYQSAFWAGLAILIVTGPLPWVAVVLANDGPPRRGTRRPVGSHPSDHVVVQELPPPEPPRPS
jgi:hypothetical protein